MMTRLVFVITVYAMAGLFYSCDQPKETDAFTRRERGNGTNDRHADSTGSRSMSQTVETVSAGEESINSISDLKRRLRKPSSSFLIRANRDTVLKCKEGTLLSIPADAFILASNKHLVTGEVRITVKEFYKTSDMIIAGLNTTSRNRLLETAGMINIKVMNAANTDSCLLKPGKKITLAMVNSDPNRVSDMQLFNGVHDSAQLTWIPKTGIEGLAQRWTADWRMFSQYREGSMEEFVFPDDVLLSRPARLSSRPEDLKMEIKMTIRELVQYGKKGVQKAYGYIDTLGNLHLYKIGNQPQNLSLTKIYSPKEYKNMKVNLGVEVVLSYSADYNYEYFQKLFGMGKGNPDSLIAVSAILKPGIKINSIDKVRKQYAQAITVSQFRSMQRRRSRLKQEYESKISRLRLEAEQSLAKSEQEVNQNLQRARAYFLLNTTELGWINNDVFNKDQNTVDFMVKLKEKANLLIVFDSIRSIMPSDANGLFEKVPANQKITIVGLKTENGKLMMAYHHAQTTKEPFEKLRFEPVSVATFKNRLEKLNKL